MDDFLARWDAPEASPFFDSSTPTFADPVPFDVVNAANPLNVNIDPSASAAALPALPSAHNPSISNPVVGHPPASPPENNTLSTPRNTASNHINVNPNSTNIANPGVAANFLRMSPTITQNGAQNIINNNSINTNGNMLRKSPIPTPNIIPATIRKSMQQNPRAQPQPQNALGAMGGIGMDINMNMNMDINMGMSIANSIPPPKVTPISPSARRLRPTADSIVTASWKSAASSASFIRKVRHAFVSKHSRRWILQKDAEAALLDALIARLCATDACPARLEQYLRHALICGAVRSRAVLSGCLSYATTAPPRAQLGISRLFCEILPYYTFDATEGTELTEECNTYLDAFAIVLQSILKSGFGNLNNNNISSVNINSQFAKSSHVNKLTHSFRFIALVRACGRRIPTRWKQIMQLIDEGIVLMNGGGDNHDGQGNMAKLAKSLKKGLGAASTNFQDVFKYACGNNNGNTINNGNSNMAITIPPSSAGLPSAVQVTLHMFLQLFGPRVEKAIREVWLEGGGIITGGGGKGADLEAFINIEKEIQQQSSSQTAKLPLRDAVRACESTIRFLAERAAVDNSQWMAAWGGKQRLLRIMRDTVPQLRGELRTERGCVIVACAIVGCAAMCLGPVLINNNNRDSNNNNSTANENENTNDMNKNIENNNDGEEEEETIEKYVSDLVSFAVGCMEDAAQAEETPAWRAFGLWLLLFATRCGSLLRASNCQHVKAARVLRAWGGMPTGTPGSHSSSGNASGHGRGSDNSNSNSNNNNNSSRAGSSSSGSAAAVLAAEVVATFASPAAHAIIDMADRDGDDATIQALCFDYVQ